MFKYLLILLSISATNSIFGQSNFGLRVDFGVSRFYDRNDELKIYPAAKSGIFYEINLGRNSVLGGELMFTQIRTMDEDKGYVNINTDSYFIATQTDYHLSYLSIPLYYGIKFNNILVNLGVEPSYNIIYSSNHKTETIINGIKDTKSRKYKSFSNDFDVGAIIGVTYQLNDRVNLEVQYHLDFNTFIGDDIYVSHIDRVDQTTVGIRYILNKR